MDLKNQIQNREIKFRGQRADNNEWVYGYFVKTPKGECRIYWQPFDTASQNTYHVVQEKTVGQFTGFKDKNGVEIYEHDICQGTREGDYNKSIVNTYGSMFCFDYGKKGKYEMSDRIDFYGIEVIGNIHENKLKI